MRIRRLAPVVAAFSSLLLAAAGCASATPKTAQKPTTLQSRYYLALGDSLSTGWQPTAKGGAGNTSQGYVNDLFAYEQRYVHGLTLVQMGCPGDTTTSLLTGKGHMALAEALKCDRAGGSQLVAAVAFLKAHHHRGEVPLVTIDIGTNDVVPCATSPEVGTCVTAGIGRINTNLPKILSALGKAAPAGTKLATMNLYDPMLHYYLLPSTDPMRALASASVPLLHRANASLASAARAAGFKLADVASAFDSYDTTTMDTWNGIQLPQDVATLCAWTWNCAPPPVGPNIHANALGYGVIAHAFEKVVGKL